MPDFDFTATWGWPQWFIVIWLFLRLGVAATYHGRDKIVSSGERKGLPERYSFPTSLMASGLLVFALIAGGFFA